MKSKLYDRIYHCSEYMEDVKDLIISRKVQEMGNFTQHGKTTCLQHCLLVSYYSFKVCRFFDLDEKSAARAGLLHDLFLYDWHKDKKFSHSFMHPRIALYNAKQSFELNDIECDMIEKHMFPLTQAAPSYLETIVISIVDKYCAVLETVCQ